MAGNSNGSASSSSSSSSSAVTAAFDDVLIQSLMSRLQLRPPYPGTNSFLSHGLDDLILQDLLSKDPIDEDDDEGDVDVEVSTVDGAEGRRRRLLAKEEAKLEKDIIRIIHSPGAHVALKANSGQSVAIGDHNICVGNHEDSGSEYRVWEWHGHIMFFDDDSGYSAEYIYGHYFEWLPDKKKKGGKADDDQDIREDEEMKIKAGGTLGLRDLIEEGLGGRVLHRNSLNAGSSAGGKK